MADLRNHAPDIAAMDLFIAPTVGFELLYAIIIVRLKPARARLDQRHDQSDRGMDRTANNGDIPVG
jgi:hypothetical protein